MFTFSHALVRKPGPNFADGLTTVTSGRPDYALMLAQHEHYVNTLRRLGMEVTILEAQPDYPDGYFVEDAAVVTPGVAVITIPGAPSRQGEQETIAPVLARFRPVARIEPPGTLEGGDVLIIGGRCFVGISERTNEAGAAQLESFLAPQGITCTAVPVGEGLHLKSSVNAVGENTLLLSEDFAGNPAFAGFEQIVLDPAEVVAGNCLLANGSLVIPAGFPKTRRQLETLDLPLIELDVSEAARMDGGLTCMSLRF
jgi:dimethylargininase